MASHTAASFGVLLARHRVAAGLSQAALAEVAGLSEQAISKLERGARRCPRRDTVARIVASLPLSPGERERLESSVSRRRGPPTRPESALLSASAAGAPPAGLTPLIGRERDLLAVAELVRSNRLVTLTGAGGVGKTRLALEAARALAGDFPDGVRLIELAPLAEAGRVPQAIATALGIRERPGQPLLATLLLALEGLRVLVVLDNCEHLVGPCASIVEAIVRRRPHVHVLATSREALRIDGELVWRVPSLSTPPDGSDTAGRVAPFGAVQLFVARAVGAKPTFALTDATAPLVAQVCRRLDGIPLGIELAAARLRVLSLDQLASRLDDRFSLLTGGHRTALPRQQTLRATVDWSYALLDADERALFARLSVFEDGFTLDAAESVCATALTGRDPAELLDLLTGLVDKSLIAIEAPVPAMPVGDVAGAPSTCGWYRLLETMRAYARDKLAASDGARDVRARHAAYYLNLCGRAQRPWLGPRATAWLDRVEREYNNVRAALAWCLAEEGDAELGVRLAVAMRWFWARRGYLSDGRQWLARALAASEGRRDSLRGAVLQGAAINAWRQGDYERSTRLSEENLVLQRRLGDPKGIGEALYALGLVSRDRGEYARSRALLSEYRALEQRRQDRLGIAWASHALGTVADELGDVADARALYGQALDMWRDLGDRSDEAGTRCALGLLLWRLGERSAAQGLLEAALATYRELGDTPGTATALGNLAVVARDRDDETSSRGLQCESLRLLREAGDRRAIAAALERCASFVTGPRCRRTAVRLCATADAVRREIGAPMPPVDRPDYERRMAVARDDLGEEAFRTAWAAGARLPLEEAIAEALAIEDGSGEP